MPKDYSYRMTRSCSECGKPMWEYHGTGARPQPRCRACTPSLTRAERKARERQSYPDLTCATCGKTYKPWKRSRPGAYCSVDCARRRGKPKATGECEHCGATFAITRDRRRFCGRDCSYAFKTLERLTRPPKQKATAPTTCRVYFQDCSECGTTFTSRHSRKVCGEKCRNRRTQRLRPVPEPKPVEYRWWECRVCDTPFAMPSWITDARYCSKRCRKQRFDSHRTRAMHAGVHYEYVRPHDIYERDGWTCGLCGDRVDELAKWPDQMCASLDHVVPISMGGPHEAGNLRLAHWLCNSLRGTDDIHFRVS